MGSQIRNINFTEESRTEGKEETVEELKREIWEEEYKLKMQDNIYNFLIMYIEGKKTGKKIKKSKDLNKMM